MSAQKSGHIEVQYVPGHTQYLTDMMSRSYLLAKDQDTYSEFEVVNVVQFLLYWTRRDSTMQVLETTILKGRPEEKV